MKKYTMKILAFLFMIFTCSHIVSQNNNSSHSFSYKLTEDLKSNQLKKYLNARDYLNQDSLYSEKNIYFSPYLVDLDFFWFKDAVVEDSVLSSKLFLKNKWFEDYNSSMLDSALCKQFEKTD